jgi:hypothetical protein
MTDTTTNPMPQTQAELEQLAAQLLQDVRSVRDRVPGLMLPPPTRRRLSGSATAVPLEAIQAGFAACETHEALAKTIAAPDVMYDHRYTSIFSELRDQSKTLSTGLDYTLRLKRYGVGNAVLQVYDFARRLEKSPEKAALRTQLQVIAKAVARRRRKAATPNGGQTTTTTTTTTTT